MLKRKVEWDILAQGVRVSKKAFKNPLKKGLMRMSNHGIRILRLILICAWLTGCVTSGDVMRMRETGKGTTQVYPVDADYAWMIAERVFHWRGMDTIEADRTKGYMLTKTKDSTISWTTFAGVWIVPIDKDQTKVTVIAKKTDPTDFFTAFTEQIFHEEFGMEVDKLKQGRSSSPVPPVAKPQSGPPEKPVPSTPVPSISTVTTVIVSWTSANIRSGPGDKYPLVATVNKGYHLTVIGQYEEWFYVRLEDNREGWIKKNVVK